MCVILYISSTRTIDGACSRMRTFNAANPSGLAIRMHHRSSKRQITKAPTTGKHPQCKPVRRELHLSPVTRVCQSNVPVRSIRLAEIGTLIPIQLESALRRKTSLSPSMGSDCAPKMCRKVVPKTTSGAGMSGVTSRPPPVRWCNPSRLKLGLLLWICRILSVLVLLLRMNILPTQTFLPHFQGW